jgi:hypothetical protein
MSRQQTAFLRRSPRLTVFLASFLGPLAVGAGTAALGLGLAPGVLGAALALFAVVMAWPDRLVDWLDAHWRAE